MILKFIPKWKPKGNYKPRKKYAKAENATLSEDDIEKYMNQPEEEEQKQKELKEQQEKQKENKKNFKPKPKKKKGNK